MIRQRSRWVKGHIDLLRERVPELSDIMGNIYWLNPILMLCGLSSITIVSFGIFCYLLFGTMPYKYSIVPILIWIGMTVVSYFLQLAVLIKQQKREGLRHAGHLAISAPFSQVPGMLHSSKLFLLNHGLTLKLLTVILPPRIWCD